MAAWRDQVEFVYGVQLALFNLLGSNMVEIEDISDPVVTNLGEYIGPCYRVTLGSLFSSRSWYVPRVGGQPASGLEAALRFASRLADVVSEPSRAERRFAVLREAYPYVEEHRE